MTYLERHAAWLRHYFIDDYTSVHLAIEPDWWKEHMPDEPKIGQGKGNVLCAEYLDTTDGKLYQTPMYAAWADCPEVYFEVWDENWNPVTAQNIKALQGYFYNDHHCPCHRKQDAEAAGAVTDSECEGTRFQIVRIWAPAHPDLILYSETMTAEELEARLRGIPVDDVYTFPVDAGSIVSGSDV